MSDNDRRTEDDKKLTIAIMDDRADRTPRSTMYLHLGLLTGAVMRVVTRGTSQTSGRSQT